MVDGKVREASAVGLDSSGKKNIAKGDLYVFVFTILLCVIITAEGWWRFFAGLKINVKFISFSSFSLP